MSRGLRKGRKLKRHMIKELGVEKFSDVLKRKLKEKNERKESSRDLCTDETQSRGDSEA